MPKRIRIEPTTTTGLATETLILPDMVYTEAETEAKVRGYPDLAAYVKAAIKELATSTRRAKKAAEVNLSDLEAL